MQVLFQKWNPVENRKRAVLAMTSSVVLGLLVLFTGAAEIFRGISYDLPHIFSRAAPPDQALIVKMDDAAHKALDQDPRGRWSVKRPSFPDWRPP